MSFHDVVAKVQPPVTAKGMGIYNAQGKPIAVCADSWMASAIADLINKGVPAAQEVRAEYERQQIRLINLVEDIEPA